MPSHSHTCRYTFRGATSTANFVARKKLRCRPSQTFPRGFDIDVWHTPNHSTNKETMLWFIKNVILPYTEDVYRKSSTTEQVALMISDVFKGLMYDSVHTLLEDNKILQVNVPNNCTDLFSHWIWASTGHLKDKSRSKFSEWYAQEVSKQLAAGTHVEQVR